MHGHSIERWQHRHVFLGEAHARNERRIWLVVALTAVMMVAEIAAGAIFGSMALMADGWHMSTHAAALAISAFAYRFARKHADDARFSFGTGKAGELAAFASAVILGVIAILIAYESAIRIFAPVFIRFDEALIVAVLGLVVNLASAWLLFDRGDDHDHDHAHPHGHHHRHDSNIRAAYLHVIADALTSVLAIVALLAGRFQGWLWLDPVIGIVGALVIARWSFGLLRSAGAVLLDMVPDGDLVARLRKSLEIDGDRVADLHVWRLGPGHIGVIASIVSDHPGPPAVYKARLAGFAELSHVSIEVQPCEPGTPRSSA
ncbi:MAG TPA: CDF family Co(II)/Ni(II) efflux transporter DmeF [Pseudorhodoplanes sp.]|nr:CDF family Co(II)/Ni(II) efflux transporter DmeF [Pseudorhodoplanes sp.]